MFPLPRYRLAVRAVTLLELMTVFLVIIILGVILLPVYSSGPAPHGQGGLPRQLCARCTRRPTSTCRSITYGPRVQSEGVEPEDFADKWVAALKPYGLTEINWVCPTIQRELQNPDLTNHETARIDYRAMPFDTNPQTPFRWSMPWFVESGDMHGNGNLMIFPDGHEQETGRFQGNAQTRQRRLVRFPLRGILLGDGFQCGQRPDLFQRVGERRHDGVGGQLIAASVEAGLVDLGVP